MTTLLRCPESNWAVVTRALLFSISVKLMLALRKYRGCLQAPRIFYRPFFCSLVLCTRVTRRSPSRFTAHHSDPPTLSGVPGTSAVPWPPLAAAQLASVHDCARRLIIGRVFFAARFGGAVNARGVADLACMHGNPEGLLCREGAVSAALMPGRGCYVRLQLLSRGIPRHVNGHSPP